MYAAKICRKLCSHLTIFIESGYTAVLLHYFDNINPRIIVRSQLNFGYKNDFYKNGQMDGHFAEIFTCVSI